MTVSENRRSKNENYEMGIVYCTRDEGFALGT